MIGSIHARIQLAALLVLVAFLGLGAAALDRAFRSSLEEATRERLMGQIYGLLAAATEDPEGRIALPVLLPDPRLGQADSGLYAQVESRTAGYSWHSGSLIGRQIRFPQVDAIGVPLFQRYEQGGDRYFTLSYRILWADAAGEELAYRFSVAEDVAAVSDQVSAFRRTLFFWLAAVSLLLLLGQGMVLRWGLRPLRQVAADLERIESGTAAALTGRYPRELAGLTGRINSLISSGRARQERYRNSLGDLAHSLKTPLAVLQGAVDKGADERLESVVREQVPRMNEIVQYQLKRAAASGFTGVHQGVLVLPVVRRLISTLDKVYRDKGISADVQGDETARFRGDQGDLMEMLGNLLENAYKYGHKQIRFRVGTDRRSGALEMTIEDDGEGIAVGLRERVIRRGERADQRRPGQGIGLSVSAEIVGVYSGELSIQDSELGGTLLKIVFSIH